MILALCREEKKSRTHQLHTCFEIGINKNSVLTIGLTTVTNFDGNIEGTETTIVSHVSSSTLYKTEQRHIFLLINVL